MIVPISMFTIKCDNCGKDLCEDDEFAGWNDKSYVRQMAQESDWYELDEPGELKHYCPDCFLHNDDDEFEIIPKP